MFFPLDDKFRMDNRRVIPYLYHVLSEVCTNHRQLQNTIQCGIEDHLLVVFFPVENKQTNDKLTATLILLVK